MTLSLVVTQPDRPKGRGMEMALSPVKQKAIELGLPIAQPEKIKNNDEFRAQLEALAPDCIVVVGYGRIVPRWMLDLPTYGNINLHASLLPKYRGAAPIQWAIAYGEHVTGNTTMRIDEGLGHGRHSAATRAGDPRRRHQRDAGSAAGGHGSRTAGGNAGRADGTALTAHAAGSCARDPGADPDTRRWTHRLYPRRADDLQPPSRLSAVARRIHHVSRQAAHVACDLAGCRSARTGRRRD